MVKRRERPPDDENIEISPRKSRRINEHNVPNETDLTSNAAPTPTRRKRTATQTPRKVGTTDGVGVASETPKQVLFSTPQKHFDDNPDTLHETPTALRNDRSARRKSARALQQYHTGNDDPNSGDEQTVQDTALAEAIVGQIETSEGENEEDGADEDDILVDSTPLATRSKHGRPRGRRRKDRTPTLPHDLPAHEMYFFQNRTGANKTSANTLPPQLLLSHEDYFARIREYTDPHAADQVRLKDLHARAFEQWRFELQEGFNLCLYGYGSKRDLVMEYAEHLYMQAADPPKIVVVNGYTPGLTPREVLATLASVVVPRSAKLPAQPSAIADMVLATLSAHVPIESIILIVHSLDHPNLRKPATQALLATLAAHPSISLVATCDTPHFALLWDSALLRQFRWLYHDATTFQAYTAEIDVVEDVNALLGRSGRRLGGKDGVGYVLKSLPENARSLFRILVAQQLAVADLEADTVVGARRESHDDIEADEILGVEDEDVDMIGVDTPSRRGRGRKPKKTQLPPRAVKPAINASAVDGVEYRTLYHKAVEEFVCSSELNFRTLLKEFHDHQMIESRKDALGTERLVVPFRREELEAILEELV